TTAPCSAAALRQKAWWGCPSPPDSPPRRPAPAPATRRSVGRDRRGRRRPVRRSGRDRSSGPPSPRCGRSWKGPYDQPCRRITGPSSTGYTLTKRGALGFDEWLALTYAHRGLTVTCLCPNAVYTGMLGRDEDAEDASSRPDEDLLARIGDVVEPELVADMALD